MAITINDEIILYLDSPNDLVLTHAVQGEYYSREVIANLRWREGSTDESWVIPDEAIPMIRYRRPDGKIGFYDFDPFGNRIVNAYKENTEQYYTKVKFTLSEDMCAVAGRVAAHIDFYSKTSPTRLSAFYFYVDVEKAATDPEIIKAANITGVTDLLKDVLGNIYQPPTNPQPGIIDNTLSIPGAVGDAAAMGNVVLVQDEQPDLDLVSNKLWINTASQNEIEVVEMNDIVSVFSSEQLYSYGDFVNKDGKIYKYIYNRASQGNWDNSKWQQIVLCDEISKATESMIDSVFPIDQYTEDDFVSDGYYWMSKKTFKAGKVTSVYVLVPNNTTINLAFVTASDDFEQHFMLFKASGSGNGLIEVSINKEFVNDFYVAVQSNNGVYYKQYQISSLTDPYLYYRQNSDEFDVEPGEKLEMTDNHWNPSSVGETTYIPAVFVEYASANDLTYNEFPKVETLNNMFVVGDSQTAGYPYQGIDGLKWWRTVGRELGYETSVANYSGMGFLYKPTGGKTGVEITNLTDFSPYNVVVYALGTNDFGEDQSLGSINEMSYDPLDPTSVNTFAKAINYVIDKVYESNPKTILIFMTPINRCDGDFSIKANDYAMGTQNGQQHTLREYCQLMIDICKKRGILCVDRTSGVINTGNVASADILGDGLHPTIYGYKLLGLEATSRIGALIKPYMEWN